MASGSDERGLELAESEPTGESGAATVEVTSERFGTVEVPASHVIRMISPIFGFALSRRYCLLPAPEGEESPFRWLQSLDQPELAFIVVNPFEFFPEYDIELPTPDQRELEIETPDECVVLALVSVPAGDPAAITANLVAPLVINARTSGARQVVLYESGYFTKHPLVPGAAGGTGPPGPTALDSE
jgi:flagellar assembly factor FliW